MAGTAGACLVGVASVAGAADVGCMHGAGGGGVGCATKSRVSTEPMVWQLCHWGQCQLL